MVKGLVAFRFSLIQRMYLLVTDVRSGNISQPVINPANEESRTRTCTSINNCDRNRSCLRVRGSEYRTRALAGTI